MLLFKKRYHYVPPCPRCNSKKTGYYLQLANTSNGIEITISNHLAKGELVKPVSVYESRYENAFCEECGCEWHANIEIRWLAKEQIINERIDRGISKEKYNAVKNVKKNTKKELRLMKKSRKKELRRQRKERKQMTKASPD